jgi:hypothetical protein
MTSKNPKDLLLLHNLVFVCIVQYLNELDETERKGKGF